MNKILNRISWISSFGLGYILANLFHRLTGYEINKLFEFFDLGYVYHWFLVLVFALLAKKVFLSKRFIELQLNQPVLDKTDQRAASKTLGIEKAEGEEATPQQIPSEKTSLNSQQDKVAEAIPDIDKRIPQQTPESAIPVAAAEIQKPVPVVPKEPSFIQRFFSENLLAKVGGILLFLGVLFLLKLVYGAIGPVGKLSIGFAIGFSLYTVGLFLDKKQLITESRVLIGTGILINYLVILSGRFLIGDGTFTDEMILNEGITFLLLIINTVLAVVTSLLYRSQTLLFFSFIVAFLNPFLIGADASATPYTLIGYGMVVALGSLALSVVRKTEDNPFIEHLLTIAFIGGNALFLVAPFSSPGHWLIKLAATGLLTLLVVFTAYKSKQTNKLGWYFLGGYLFLIALLTYGRVELTLQFETLSVILSYLLLIVLFLVVSVITFAATSLLLVYATLAMPLIILLGLAYSQSLNPSDLVYVLTSALVIYVSIFAMIASRLAIWMQYLFFALLGVFACLAGFLLLPISQQFTIHTASIIYPDFTGALAVVISAFIFQLSTYYFSTRKDLQYLYSMGSGFSILLLLLIIQRQGNLLEISIVSIGGFLFLNLILPFTNRLLLESKIKNLMLGLVAGVLFTAGEIYYFGERYFSGLELGLAFLCQAVLYFGLGYAMYNKLIKTSIQTAQDVVYTMLGISISLFSLAIAFVFSKHSEVVSAVWLFEACLIFFFYSRSKDIKLFVAAAILMAIGVVKQFDLVFQIKTGEFLSLIPLAVVFAAYVAMLKFLADEKRSFRWVHDLLHLAGLALLGVLLVIIIPSHGHGFSILGISVAVILLAVIYARIYAHNLRLILVGGWILFFIFHVMVQPKIDQKLYWDHLTYLIGLQYLSTILLGCGVYLYNKILNPEDVNASIRLQTSLLFLNAAYAIYLFVITSVYVYNFFNENSFIITIYWGLVTFALLSFGIQKDMIRWRTLGLYILSLTVSKIMFFDVWQKLDAAVYRILALMLVGGLMIIISILYQKKYNGSLLKELKPENLR